MYTLPTSADVVRSGLVGNTGAFRDDAAPGDSLQASVQPGTLLCSHTHSVPPHFLGVEIRKKKAGSGTEVVT